MTINIKRFADYINNIIRNLLLVCDGLVNEVYRFFYVRKSLIASVFLDDKKLFINLSLTVLQAADV
jgi:hypothetical protein